MPKKQWPRHNLAGFRFHWTEQDLDILHAAVDLFFIGSPDKLSHKIFESALRKGFRARIRHAGSWAISLEYNRLCRLFGVACKSGSGTKEILAQIPHIERYIKSKFPNCIFKFNKKLLKERGLLT